MLNQKTEHRLGMACHLLGFAGLLLPLGHIIAPLVLWLMKKDDSPASASSSKQAFTPVVRTVIANSNFKDLMLLI